MALTLREAYRKGARSRFATNADWDDALARFTERWCSHASEMMCPTCHAWCDGFSGIEFHDTSVTPCDH